MTTDEAEAFVQKFLRLMEARDLEAANAMITSDARIIFPGGKVFGSQTEMVAASKGRYQWIKKTFDRIDSATSSDEEVIVYVMGTLYGVNTAGIDFAGIRYIDRFVIRDGLIVSQEVWNDLAESGMLQKKA